MPTSAGRLQFLDGLRGLAAVAVLVAHGGERMSASVDWVLTNVIQIGQLAVALFFMISGFVIPLTLERRGQMGFWTSRIFRLFPLYLTVLAVSYVLYRVGLWHIEGHFGRTEWLANATMLHLAFDIPHAVNTFWTLYFEMAFYVLMSLLFLVRLNRYSGALVLVCLAVANVDVIRPLGIPLMLGGIGPMVFSFMLMGTVFFRLHQGRIGSLTAGIIWLLLAATVVHVAYARWHGSALNIHGTTAVLPMMTAWLAALALFTAGYLLRHAPWPRLLIWLGAISYSVYLWHLLVMDVGRGAGQPAHVYLNHNLTYLGYIAVTIGLSWLSYRFLEQPLITLGHRLAGRFSPPREARFKGQSQVAGPVPNEAPAAP